MENIDKLKLLLFAFSPVIISKLFSHVLWVGMEISFLSILFCIYWYYVGYKSYDYIELHLNNYCTLFILKEDRFYSKPTIYSKEDVVKSIIFEDLEIKLNDIFV